MIKQVDWPKLGDTGTLKGFDVLCNLVYVELVCRLYLVLQYSLLLGRLDVLFNS